MQMLRQVETARLSGKEQETGLVGLVTNEMDRRSVPQRQVI